MAVIEVEVEVEGASEKEITECPGSAIPVFERRHGKRSDKESS